MPAAANATGARNKNRLITVSEALHAEIEAILQEREQDTPWHRITALQEHETKDAARAAFGEMRARYRETLDDLSEIGGAREDFAEQRTYVDQLIPERAAPTPAMMSDRPTLRDAFIRAAHAAGGVVPEGNGQQSGSGLRVHAEDVNLPQLHAAIDVGTGNQGLDTPGAITPGTPLAFGNGMMMVDLFQARAWTLPNTSKIQWNAGSSDGGVANFKGADGSNTQQDAVGNIGNYEEDLTRGHLYADVDMRAGATTDDAINFAMDSLNYSSRHAWSNQAVTGNGTSPNNHGFESYIGASLPGTTTKTTQAFGAVTGAQQIGYMINKRTDLAKRGWPPMVYALNPTAYGLFMTEQFTTGTGFEGVFGPLYATMQASLRGTRIVEIVRGMADAAADATWCVAYPFDQGMASAVHWLQYFELLRDPFTRVNNAEIRYHLFCWDGFQVKQPRALGTLTYMS